jgi:aryl sulfotransferase
MTLVQPRRYKNVVFDSARWEGFRFRPDDIVISTPPKCGTTWTQMICALLILQTPAFDRSVDLISPWLDMQTRDLASVRADLDAQTHRRFIKPTHRSMLFRAIPRSPTSASGATRATSFVRGTTTSTTWTSRRSSWRESGPSV